MGAKILENRISFKGGAVLAVLATLALLLFLQAPAWAATFNVNAERDAPDANPGDGQCATAAGDCTLRAAVMEANANGQADTIDLPAGDYDLTIAGEDNNAQAGDLDITTDITINGAGRDSTTVNGEAVDRSFEVRDGATAEISGVTVTEGGAGPENDDTDEGGGILVRKGSGLTLNDSAVTGNSAKKKGGGIFNDGTLDVNNTNIDNNQAADEGGGIFNKKEGTLTLDGSTVNGNEVEKKGGGIFNEGEQGDLTLTDTTVNNNSAGDEGGGIFNKRGALELTDSTVSGNDAKKGAGIYDENKDAPTTLIGTDVSDNVADEEGGGIFNKAGALDLRDSTVSGNEAGREGGGIFNESKESPLTVTDSTVSNNSSDEDGGGIFNEKGTFEVTRSTINGNTAGTNGGGIRNNGGEALLDAVNSTISNNTANNEGGGIRNNDAETRLLNVTLNQNSGAQGSNLSSLGNVIFAENTIVANGQNSPNCAGPINSQGDNLDTGASCGFDQASDIENGNPNLGPLRDNGGPTKTHALRVESDAIDAANNGPCPATDQRNESRPQDGNGDGQASCDIGAFENQPSDLSIQKDAPETVDAGEEFTYTITVTNNGPGTASGAEFTDRLPDGVTPSGDLPQDCTYEAQSNTVTCDLGRLANGETVERQIQVTSSTTGEKVNEAEVKGNTRDNNPDNDSATETTTVQPASDLSLTIQAPGRVNDEQKFTYTLVVENAGPSPAAGVTITDDLPGKVEFVSAANSCAEANGEVTCEIGALQSGEKAERKITVRAKEPGKATSTANVESATAERETQNNDASATTRILASADLSIDNRGPSRATDENRFTYTLNVKNNGPSNARNVRVTDDLPGGVKFISASRGCDNRNGTVRCGPFGLQNGAAKQIKITVRAKQPGQRVNRASVSSATGDPAKGNNRDSVTTVIRSRPTQSKPAPAPDTCKPGRSGKTISGTPGNDVLRGTPGDDTFLGFGGNDRIIGGNGEDSINAGEGSDTVKGGPCNDSIIGRGGNDTLYGEGGNDSLIGGAGRDRLFGGSGRDSFVGSDGRDQLYARDGNKEPVNGGPGRDGCRTDKNDSRTSCP